MFTQRSLRTIRPLLPNPLSAFAFTSFHSPLCGRDADEIELAEHLVVGGHLTLPLERLDLHLALVVRCRGERLHKKKKRQRDACPVCKPHRSCKQNRVQLRSDGGPCENGVGPAVVWTTRGQSCAEKNATTVDASISNRNPAAVSVVSSLIECLIDPVPLRLSHLNLLGRDGGVTVDELGHNAAEGFDTQRQGSNVQQQDVLHASPQDTSLSTPPQQSNSSKTSVRRSSS